MSDSTVAPIRNFETWSKSLRNFADWIGSAVPGAMDLDFFCERNGRFLVIEGKAWQSGLAVPYGQHKALYALSQEPNFRVYLAGEDGDDVVHLARYDTAPKPMFMRERKAMWWSPETFIPSTKQQLASLVKAWWKDAEAAA